MTSFESLFKTTFYWRAFPDLTWVLISFNSFVSSENNKTFAHCFGFIHQVLFLNHFCFKSWSLWSTWILKGAILDYYLLLLCISLKIIWIKLKLINLDLFFQGDRSKNIPTSMAPVQHVAGKSSTPCTQPAAEWFDKQVKIHPRQESLQLVLHFTFHTCGPV